MGNGEHGHKDSYNCFIKISYHKDVSLSTISYLANICEVYLKNIRILPQDEYILR